MEQEVTVSIYLHTRVKKSGKSAVMICIYNPVIKERKYYGTKFDLNQKEYEKFYPKEKGKNPTGDKDLRLMIEAERMRALNIINAMGDFSFAEFEKNWIETENGITPKVKDVYSVYQSIIDGFKKSGNIGTASNYECSLKAIQNYHNGDTLKFEKITKDWLTEFAKDLTETKGRSITTLSMYLRALRTVFNTAISERIINAEMYPFGKKKDPKKFSIPAPKGVKKALDKAQLKKLFESKPATPDQQKALDFFFFSYSCNGMNFKDIAFLKFININDDLLTFERAKTINTIEDTPQITVYLNEFSNGIIEKYGNTNKAKNQYIFDIIDHTATAETQHKQLKNFVRYVNQHLKKLAKNNGVSGEISTYWARHSFATNAIKSGASMEFAMEALGHSNMKTTKSYFAGFGNEKKKEISNKLMQF